MYRKSFRKLLKTIKTDVYLVILQADKTECLFHHIQQSRHHGHLPCLTLSYKSDGVDELTQLVYMTPQKTEVEKSGLLGVYSRLKKEKEKRNLWFPELYPG